METTSYHSYPKVYALGHRAIETIFDDNVIVQEKIDGSQFSFGVFDGVVKCRSRGQQLDIEAPEKMFSAAVSVVLEIADQLEDGWTYRGEYLSKPKHNTMAYDRIPNGHIILFDVNTGHEKYSDQFTIDEEAKRLGLESVPMVYEGAVTSPEQVKSFMTEKSVLGGCTPEGVVVKNYDRFTPDGKAMMGKYVTEQFKERHQTDWKERNPGGKDIVTSIADTFNKEAIWQKAIQHLAESGDLQNAPQDIGPILKELHTDVIGENKQDIMDALFKWAWPQLSRRITAGFPQWYKDKLLDESFSHGKESE